MYNQKPIMTVRYEINPPKISDDGQDIRKKALYVIDLSIKGFNHV